MQLEHRVIVFGAGGFPGRHIVEALAEHAEWAITAADDPGQDTRFLERLVDRRIELDMEDPEAVSRAVRGHARVLNAVDHFDLSLDRRELARRHFHAADHVAQACVEHKVRRLVHLSSAGVYGRPVSVPTDETAPIRPANAYETSKAMAEQRLWDRSHAESLPLVVLRPAMMYGPWAQHGTARLFALYSLLKYQGQRKVIAPFGGARMHHVAASDVARAARLLLEATDAAVIGRAFNVADETPISWGTFLQTLVQRLGMKPATRQGFPEGGRARRLAAGVRYLPPLVMDAFNRSLMDRWRQMVEHGIVGDRLPPRLNRELVGYLACDHIYDTRAVQALGFTPQWPQTTAGLRATMDWYRDNFWIYN